MTKLVLAAKRAVAIVVILVYLGGICSDFVVQSSHLIYHFITQTFHQHIIQNQVDDHHFHHSHSHEHGHDHTHLIDQALELDKESDDQNQPETPANKVSIKFNDHLSKSILTGNTNLKALRKINSPYSFIPNEYSAKPLIPPPKYS